MAPFFATYLSLKKRYYFLLVVSLLLLIGYFQQELTLVFQLQNPVVEKIGRERFITIFNKYRWIGFLFVPIVVLIRVCYTSICLYIGKVFNGITSNAGFVSCYNIALKADIVFVLSSILSFILILCSGVQQGQQAMQYTSLLCLVDVDTLDKWLVAPLAAINVFEVLYWLFMAQLLTVSNTIKYGEALRFVVSSYGLGFLLYLIFMMFLLLYLIV
ncbi:hypothetical protein FACS1894201_03780 [Bacteroidia bacterium]|nr:hypothetical protein FACS1894201_03780 [Bacteroidia bacterium]